MEKKTEVLIIGAGISGITAAIYLKRANVSFRIFDKGAPGGKLNNIHRIDNYSGFPSVSGPELAQNLLKQAQNLGISIDYGDVVGVKKQDDGFFAIVDGEGIECKTLIVATGLSQRKEMVPGEKEHLGSGVSYCATCDGNFFKNKTVAVVGFEDHAIEDALYLAGLAKKVYFFAPKELQGPESHLSELFSLKNVEVHKNSVLISIFGDPLVSRVEVSEDGLRKNYETDAVFPLLGEAPSLAFVTNLGLVTNQGFLSVNENMETSLPGVFACGDIVFKKLRQLVTAASDGAIAATSAISYLRSYTKH